jgi:hypothetical protein
MITSFSLKSLGPTPVGIRRIFISAAGVAAFGVVLYKAPDWWDSWHTGAVVGAIAAAAAVLVIAIGVAVRGSAPVIHRVAIEMSFLACALIAAESILLFRAPEKWSDDPAVGRMIAYERVARAQGSAFDARLLSEVVGDLRAKGVGAVPRFAGGDIAHPAVTKAIRERGLMPLANAANVVVVECNEGTGYLKFRSDQFGFNNPPGLVAGPIDVAVIGESSAVGHCVAPSTSAVDRVRARFPRTANFGVAGSRTLSQLGVFREYVEPLEPAAVVWFVNVHFADPGYETSNPLLLRYLNDASFSQGLRQRQDDVNSFVREVLVPLNLRHDAALRKRLDDPRSFPLGRVPKLVEVRRVVHLDSATRRAPAPPNLSLFKLAVDRVVKTADRWGGRVIVVVLPSYGISAGRPQDVERYRAVLNAVRAFVVPVVDGAALFAAEPNFRALYLLRMENHPNERGHAIIGDAVIAAIEARKKL